MHFFTQQQFVWQQQAREDRNEAVRILLEAQQEQEREPVECSPDPGVQSDA